MLRTSCFFKTCALFLAIGFNHSLLTQSASADLVTFDLGLSGNSSTNGLDLNGLSFATTNVFGNSFAVTMNATTGTSGIFRLNNTGLGINSLGNDRQNHFDDRNVPNEWMDFSFWVSQPARITFVSLDLRDISGNGRPGEDQASLIFAGGNTFGIDGSNVNALDQFSLSELYIAGENVSLLHAGGNGFRLQAITLDIQLITVPESPSLAIFAGGSGIVALKRKRRN